MAKVLMAIDDSAGSKAVLTVYRSLHRRPECVVLVHVVRNEGLAMMSDGQRTGASERVTDRLVNLYRHEIERMGPVAVKAVVTRGVPAEEILRVAGEEHADVIIMGRKGRSGFLRPAGRVVREVEQVASVPVLVAKTDRLIKSITYGWRGAYAS